MLLPMLHDVSKDTVVMPTLLERGSHPVKIP